MAADCLALIVSRAKGTKEERKLFDTTLIWINEKKVNYYFQLNATPDRIFSFLYFFYS